MAEKKKKLKVQMKRNEHGAYFAKIGEGGINVTARSEEALRAAVKAVLDEMGVAVGKEIPFAVVKDESMDGAEVKLDKSNAKLADARHKLMRMRQKADQFAKEMSGGGKKQMSQLGKELRELEKSI